MCKKIEEVTGFRYDGKLHTSREAAIDYSLGEIAAQLQRRHVNDIKKGLLEYRDDLIYLLTQHEIESRPKSAPAGKDPEGPEDNYHTEDYSGGVLDRPTGLEEDDTPASTVDVLAIPGHKVGPDGAKARDLVVEKAEQHRDEIVAWMQRRGRASLADLELNGSPTQRAAFLNFMADL